MMKNKSKPFIIFPYYVGGRQYVEAYPVHPGALFTISDSISNSSSFPGYRVITLKPSRNQARLFAYKLWINPTGRGYNRFPFSPASIAYMGDRE